MNTATTLETNSNSLEDTLRIAGILGRNLKGGETIELIGDLGAGKTAFVRGLVQGMESQDQVQSPSFTISRLYRSRDGREIHHYDFHRLDDPGLLKQELTESLAHPKSSVVIEWADRVADILPADRLKIAIKPTGENERSLSSQAGKTHQHLLKILAP